MSKTESIIHVEFISGTLSGQHAYFGSIAAIFDQYKKEHVGCSAEWLYQFDIESWKPFKNKKCIIRKGIIQRKRWKEPKKQQQPK